MLRKPLPRDRAHCLQPGRNYAGQAHIRMLMDCAEICRASANFMQRVSPLLVQTCAACAEVCKACAEDCKRFKDDEMMAGCAKACQSCDASCRQIARMPMKSSELPDHLDVGGHETALPTAVRPQIEIWGWAAYSLSGQFAVRWVHAPR